MAAYHRLQRSIAVLWLLFGLSHYFVTYAKPKSQGLSGKRIVSEWKEINLAGLDLQTPFNSSKSECGIRLSPMRDNLLEWHFSFTGMEGSKFEGGVYHGKIKLHPEYPRKAPVISVSTPSGRWEVYTPICLSASAYHQELWNPNWNLRTLVMSLRGFMITQPGEIGSIQSTSDTQRALARLSNSFVCSECGIFHSNLQAGSLATRNGLTKLLLPKDEKRVQKLRMATRKRSKPVPNPSRRRPLSIVSRLPSFPLLAKSALLLLSSVIFMAIFGNGPQLFMDRLFSPTS